MKKLAACVLVAIAAFAAPSVARAAQCGLPDATPVWIDYAEGTIPAGVRTLFARPALVLAGSGTVLPRQQRAAGAKTVFWYMHLRLIAGTPSEPTDPATVPAAADNLFARAVTSSACETPLIALNELAGAGLAPPWSATNAQYRANVLSLLRRLHEHGARPLLLISSPPFTGSEEAAAWWREAASYADLVREVYFNANYIHSLGPIVGSRTRRNAFRRAVSELTAIGIPASKLGVMLGFQVAPGNGGREGLELQAWLQVVKREVLAARHVAGELGVATVWSWGWGVFGPESDDPDKPTVACIYLWTRDPALCDGPTAAGAGFNADLVEGQLLLPPGVQCSSAAGQIPSAALDGLVSVTGDRAVAFTALLRRLVQSVRAPLTAAELQRGEDAVVRLEFGGSMNAYLAELARRGITRAVGREVIGDELRRRKLEAILQAEGWTGTVDDWTLAEQQRALATAICLRDELPAAGVVDLGTYLPFVRAAVAPVPPPPPVSPPPPAKLAVARFAAVPRSPRSGRRFSVALRVLDTSGAAVASGRITCAAKVVRRPARLLRKTLARGTAICVWRVPRRAAGNRLRGAVTVTAAGASARRPFAIRIRR